MPFVNPERRRFTAESKVEGSAMVSYTMQLDASVTEQDYNDRYYLYTFFFKDYKNRPFMFYTGDRDSTMNGFVQLLLSIGLRQRCLRFLIDALYSPIKNRPLKCQPFRLDF